MNKLSYCIGAIALAILPSLSLAQTVKVPNVQAPDGTAIQSTAAVLTGSNGVEKGTAANPMNVAQTNASGQRGGGATYVAAGSGYTAYATPTDMIAIRGSDTKTVLITNVQLQISATAAAQMTLTFIKRSSADTGGTPTSPTIVANDSSNATPTAAVSLYGAAPVLGTAVGNVYVIGTSATASTATGSLTGLAPANTRDIPRSVVDLRQPITLHGSGEMLVVNFGGAALPAGCTMLYYIEWVEI